MYGDIRDYAGFIARLDFHHVGILARLEISRGQQHYFSRYPTSLVSEIAEFECYCQLIGSVEFVMPYGGKLLKALNEHGPRLHHVAFQVLDILEECDKAMNDGFILLRSKPVIGVGGMLINFILPERRGVLVELVQCQR